MRKSGIRISGIAMGLLLSSAAWALDPGPLCEGSKNQEAGKYFACRSKADKKAIFKNQPADYGKCDNSFAAKWTKAETKGAGNCPTSGDQPPMQTFLAGLEDATADILSGASAIPVCGDGAKDALLGEECDGHDDALCRDTAATSFCGGGCLCQQNEETLPCAPPRSDVWNFDVTAGQFVTVFADNTNPANFGDLFFSLNCPGTGGVFRDDERICTYGGQKCPQQPELFVVADATCELQVGLFSCGAAANDYALVVQINGDPIIPTLAQDDVIP